MPLSDISSVFEVTRNDLAHLQLRIARRADQLARLVITDPATDLALWLQAEEEIFAHSRKGET